ncbi:MAG: tRNA threonylcarbamoyladenosine dehydratase [Kiritimatiellaeota bacterium]|nr:tRNA threonylcarbamoyladenosine dehydratase [Kiritimatiellota bacterium]
MTERTEMVLGKEGVRRLREAHVAVFGLGGVGSFCAEALARCGVGRFTLVDHDVVSASNINRQLVALHSTVGQPKVEVMKTRMLDINPTAEIAAMRMFYRPECAEAIDFASFSAMADAMDTTRAKLDVAVRATALGVPLVSCMGMGNRLDPTQVRAGELFETDTCPMCRVMRKKLRTRHGITSLRAIYSLETPVEVEEVHAADTLCTAKRPTPGSIVLVPAAAGLALAAEIVKLLL